MTIRKTARAAAAPARKHPQKRSQSIWDRIEALGEEISREELARFPADGARNLHHYLHGTPKQDPP